MAPQPESTALSEWARSVDPWVWPAIAAVAVGGVLLLTTTTAICWLAVRSDRQPIVIWLPQNAQVTAAELDSPAHAPLAPATKEKGDVATN